jgi:uncharacterized protein
VKHYVLNHDLVGDYLECRQADRGRQLAHARRPIDRGEVSLGAARADPAGEAILRFSGNTGEVARRFAEADPYVAGGLVTDWQVREWTTVVGAGAAHPAK